MKRDTIVKSLSKMLDKMELDYEVELSRAPGSVETFYITIYADDYNSYKIRYSTHKANDNTSDYYVWVDAYKTLTQIKNKTREIIDSFELQPEPIIDSSLFKLR